MKKIYKKNNNIVLEYSSDNSLEWLVDKINQRECFQWNNEYDLEEVKEELADVLNYCIQMANKLGVDPKQIVLDKMEKTAKKYPVEKAKGKSTKYTKL